MRFNRAYLILSFVGLVQKMQGEQIRRVCFKEVNLQTAIVWDVTQCCVMDQICVVKQRKCEGDQTKRKNVLKSNSLHNLPALCRTLWFPPVWLIHHRVIWNVTSTPWFSLLRVRVGLRKSVYTNPGLKVVNQVWIILVKNCFSLRMFWVVWGYPNTKQKPKKI